MAGVWSVLKSTWLLAEVTACDASSAPSDTQLRNIASHSVQSDRNVTSLCDCMLDDLKDWQKNSANAFKILQIIDYCIHEGSCEITEWFQPHIQLFEDLGAKQPSEASRLGVYSSEIATLLRNEAILQAERVNSTTWKPRMKRTINQSWEGTSSVINQAYADAEPPPPYTPTQSGKGLVEVNEKSVDDGKKED